MNRNSWEIDSLQDPPRSRIGHHVPLTEGDTPQVTRGQRVLEI